MDLNWKEKFRHNLASIKFWVFVTATVLLACGVISEYIWAGIAGGLMGVARVFEYYTSKKNGVKPNG